VNTKHQLGRALIVFGYSLAAVGAIISLCYTLSQPYSVNVRSVINYVAYPVSFLAGLCAWWFLSALVVSEPRQIDLVRRAFVGLAVQALALSVAYFIIVTSGITLNWVTVPIWFYAVGQVSAGVGFFMIFLGYQTPMVDDEVADAVPEAELA
jgi:hypothetical protein